MTKVALLCSGGRGLCQLDIHLGEKFIVTPLVGRITKIALQRSLSLIPEPVNMMTNHSHSRYVIYVRLTYRQDYPRKPDLVL